MDRYTQKWVGLVFGVVVVVAGVLFFMHSRTAFAPTTGGNAQTSGVATTSLGHGVSVSAPSGTVVKLIPPASGAPIVAEPSLSGPIIISTDLPADAGTLLKTKETAVIAALQKDPTDANAWLSLGIDRKIGGDYAGAAAAWEYVAKLAPHSTAYIAYGNLGDLYMNYLKNYPVAESDYQKAIAINPQVIDYYRSLYTLYKYLYKTNTSAAADILAQGLKANPGNADLLQLQKQ